MKAIILAGGLGSRLHPATQVISKQLLPLYEKPMIYYPLSTLLSIGLRDILVITTPGEAALFKQLLGDGSQWGISIRYAAQPHPEGIAQAFLIAQSFIETDSVCLILGDNIFYGHGLANTLMTAIEQPGATIFSYRVSDPERYGVVVLDDAGNPVDIVEKPSQPLSDQAIVGCYFYDHQVVELAKELTFSSRGELEITDINRAYLAKQCLCVKPLGRGIAWLDTGTPDSLLEAANFIRILEHRQGLKIGCPEEIAWRMGFIDSMQLESLAKPLLKSGYGHYLLSLLGA
jgi:glucose-1-phosphate thymidylyltransferase, short form